MAREWCPCSGGHCRAPEAQIGDKGVICTLYDHDTGEILGVQPMTKAQRVKANILLAQNNDPMCWIEGEVE
jgi:hypothetical protein